MLDRAHRYLYELMPSTAILIHEVLCLEVPVDYILGMHVRDSSEKLLHHNSSMELRELLNLIQQVENSWSYAGSHHCAEEFCFEQWSELELDAVNLMVMLDIFMLTYAHTVHTCFHMVLQPSVTHPQRRRHSAASTKEAGVLQTVAWEGQLFLIIPV